MDEGFFKCPSEEQDDDDLPCKRFLGSQAQIEVLVIVESEQLEEQDQIKLALPTKQATFR